MKTTKITPSPWEILEEAKKQVVPGEKTVQPSGQNLQSGVPETAGLQQKDKQLASRQMEALNQELADIAKDKLLRLLQEKIANGEVVYLEEYPQLSFEQKQVLQAQIEVVAKQRQVISGKQQDRLIEPTPKKSRRFFNFGRKTTAERQKTRVERPLPPSG